MTWQYGHISSTKGLLQFCLRISLDRQQRKKNIQTTVVTQNFSFSLCPVYLHREAFNARIFNTQPRRLVSSVEQRHSNEQRSEARTDNTSSSQKPKHYAKSPGERRKMSSDTQKSVSNLSNMSKNKMCERGFWTYFGGLTSAFGSDVLALFEMRTHSQFSVIRHFGDSRLLMQRLYKILFSSRHVRENWNRQ